MNSGKFSWVQIELYGKSLERFLNLCRNAGIILSDIKYREGKILAFISSRDIFKIKEFTHITSTRVRIVRKNGKLFSMLKYRNRLFFLLGILLAIGIIFAFSGRLWKINIVGNSYYSKETINRFLTDNNIKIGMDKKKISCFQLENNLRHDFDRISFVSVGVINSTLEIEIDELNEIEIKQKDVERDIVASVDGTVHSIITRSGTPIVKEGDNVKKGDVLVMSKVDSVNESEELFNRRYVMADADIYIDTSMDYEDEIDRKYNKKIYTGNIEVKKILKINDRYVLPDRECKFELYDSFTEKFDKEGNTEYKIVTYKEYVLEETKYTDEEMKSILEQRMSDYIKKIEENGVQILSDSVTINCDEKKSEVSGVIYIRTSEMNYMPPVKKDEQ